jgi:hypothetical protein
VVAAFAPPDWLPPARLPTCYRPDGPGPYRPSLFCSNGESALCQTIKLHYKTYQLAIVRFFCRPQCVKLPTLALPGSYPGPLYIAALLPLPSIHPHPTSSSSPRRLKTKHKFAARTEAIGPQDLAARLEACMQYVTSVLGIIISVAYQRLLRPGATVGRHSILPSGRCSRACVSSRVTSVQVSGCGPRSLVHTAMTPRASAI